MITSEQANKIIDMLTEVVSYIREQKSSAVAKPVAKTTTYMPTQPTTNPEISGYKGVQRVKINTVYQVIQWKTGASCLNMDTTFLKDNTSHRIAVVFNKGMTVDISPYTVGAVIDIEITNITTTEKDGTIYTNMYAKPI